MLINVRVVPCSDFQEVKKINDLFLIHLLSCAEKNKANIELISVLSKYFNIHWKKIKIKSGIRGRIKIVEILN